jgi:hypothetical protein
MKIKLWNRDLPDLPYLPDLRNRTVSVGRFKDGSWLLKGSCQEKRKGKWKKQTQRIRLTDDALGNIIQLINKIAKGELK